jgi:hypothetical protein
VIDLIAAVVHSPRAAVEKNERSFAVKKYIRV